MRAIISLIIIFIFLLYTPITNAVDHGVSYNWYAVNLNTCPTSESISAFLPLYSSVRSQVNAQLQQMRANGINILRVLVGWGDDYAGAANYSSTGALISPPNTVVPDSYIDNIETFIIDVRQHGFSKITLSLGGAGSYSPGNCGTDMNALVIPTFINGLDKLMQRIVLPSLAAGLNIRIDLTNEISPSNYESSCTKNQRINFINAT